MDHSIGIDGPDRSPSVDKPVWDGYVIVKRKAANENRKEDET